MPAPLPAVADSDPSVVLPSPELANVRYFEDFSWSVLQAAIDDDEITEIIVTKFDSIFFERNGLLFKSEHQFANPRVYDNFIQSLSDLVEKPLSSEKPIQDSYYKNLRISIVGKEITHAEAQLSVRRHPTSAWTFEKLFEKKFLSQKQIQILLEMIQDRKNFLIIGPAGCGKTSFLNACLAEIPDHQRTIVIEDTKELELPSALMSRFLTRQTTWGELATIDQSHLVKAALRQRPDRIIIGEIRGDEAKDLILALSTGHSGSLGSLHARGAREALIRLEMLVQLGAPQWSLHSLRTLIYLSVEYLVVLEKVGPERRLKEIVKLCGLEETGYLLETV